MNVYDNNTGVTTAMGKIVSYIGKNLVDRHAVADQRHLARGDLSHRHGADGDLDEQVASTGAANSLLFASGANEVLVLTAKSASNSTGGTDTSQHYRRL